RGKPVLPAEAEGYITRFRTCPLTLHVVVEFRSEGDVVQRRKPVVQIHHSSEDFRSARKLVRIGALREKWSVEGKSVGRCEWKAVIGDDTGGGGIQHIFLIERVHFPREMPIRTDPVIPSQTRPLKVIVSPGSIIDGISHHVNGVPGTVALP